MHQEQRLQRSVSHCMPHSPNDLRLHFRIFMAAFALVAISIIGCADFGTGVPPAVDGGGGDSTTVLFATHVLPIFQANCGGGLCHNPCGPNNGRGLCLVSHATLVAGSVTIAGDAQNSLLVQHLDGRRNPRMPYGRLPLNDSLIQLIRTWIDEGALNN